MKNNHKYQFGNLVFIIRDVKCIWKLDFLYDGKRQRPSIEMKATSENDGLITENPVSKVKLPKNTNAKKFRMDMFPFSENEIALLLKSAPGQFRCISNACKKKLT